MNNEDPLSNNPQSEQASTDVEQTTGQSINTIPNATPAQPLQQSVAQQPLPVQEPVIFSQPPIEQPQQPQFIGATPPPSSNTRSLKPFTYGGAALVLIAILGLTGFAFFVPNQADYNTAIDSYNKVVDANNKLVTHIEEFDKYLADSTNTPATQSKIEDDYQSYKDAFKELESLKALRDDETSKAYTNFSKKNDEYTKYLDGVLGSYEDIVGIDKDCSPDFNTIGDKVGDDITQLVPAYDEVIEPCKKALENLLNSDEDLISSFGNDSLAYLDNLRNSMQDLVKAYQSGNQTAFLAAQGELTQLDEEYLTRADKFGKDMEKESDDKSIKDAAHDFKDILEKKAKNSIF